MAAVAGVPSLAVLLAWPTDHLTEAARVAHTGVSDLYAARSRVRNAVRDAQTAEYDVGEDLSVTDRMGGGSTAQRAAAKPKRKPSLAISASTPPN